MSVLDVHDLRRALLQKGFAVDETHHEMYWFYVDGRRSSVRTRISHGAKEYGAKLAGLVARQLFLSRRQLAEFVECSLTAELYRDHLVGNGHVTP
jgi:hypothetical protein